MKNNSKHKCSSNFNDDIYYSTWGPNKEYSGWTMEINGGEYGVKINFCPFCGEKLSIV